MNELPDSKHDYLVRQLRYRLQRQGMLELDAWLSPLQDALEKNHPKVIEAVEYLLSCEAPELLAMQTGKQKIPEELKPWLNF